LNGVLSSGRTEKDETGEERSLEHDHHFLWFVLAGQTVNFPHYSEILRRLLNNVRRLHLEFGGKKNSLFHHENTSSHVTVFTRDFFYKKQHDCRPPTNTIELIEAVLNTPTEHDFQDAFKNGRSAGTVHTAEGDYFECYGGQ
jgi:hypothetical protein